MQGKHAQHAISFIAFTLLALGSLSLAGCMSNAMRLDQANHPKYQDDYARFRTTYYFRVYDYCRDAESPQIAADALYRFRMTGKANSLTNSVKFESGTVSKEMIDPFGAAVEFNSETRRFTVYSAEQMLDESRRLKRMEDADSLVEFMKELDEIKAKHKDSPELNGALDDLMNAGARAAVREIEAYATPNQPTGAKADRDPDQVIAAAVNATGKAEKAKADAANLAEKAAAAQKTADAAADADKLAAKAAATEAKNQAKAAEEAAVNAERERIAAMATAAAEKAGTAVGTSSSAQKIALAAAAGVAAIKAKADATAANAEAERAAAAVATAANKPEAEKAKKAAADKVKELRAKADEAEKTAEAKSNEAKAELSNAPVSPSATPTADEALSRNACKQLQRGFQILGPEGWRVFNQSDRLILAMSSSGQPLINTLKELSNRMLNEQVGSAEFSQAFQADELKTYRAQASFERVDATNMDAVLDALIRAKAALADEVKQ